MRGYQMRGGLPRSTRRFCRSSRSAFFSAVIQYQYAKRSGAGPRRRLLPRQPPSSRCPLPFAGRQFGLRLEGLHFLKEIEGRKEACALPQYPLCPHPCADCTVRKRETARDEAAGLPFFRPGSNFQSVIPGPSIVLFHFLNPSVDRGRKPARKPDVRARGGVVRVLLPKEAQTGVRRK